MAAVVVLSCGLGCGADSGRGAAAPTAVSSASGTPAAPDAGHADGDGDCEAPLQVYGRDMGGQYQNVSVFQNGVGVQDALVEVNGQPLTHPPGYYDDTYYGGALMSSVPVDGNVVLKVVRGACSVDAVGEVPEAPFLTAPPNGATFAKAESMTVTWKSTTDPDHFMVNAQWSCGYDCGTGVRFSASGSARQFVIPPGSVPPLQDVTLSVFSYNDGKFSGDDYEPYAKYEGMNIRGEWNRVTVSVR